MLTLVLHNIRSIYNVGAILRTAEGLGVEEVLISGYTPWPKRPGILPHLSEKLENQIAKTALGAEKMLKVAYIEDLDKELAGRKSQGWQLAGLENNQPDQKTIYLNDPELDQKISGKLVLILGEEVAGIEAKILNQLDLLLEIPMIGAKESFNVSVATAIALWELKKPRE